MKKQKCLLKCQYLNKIIVQKIAGYQKVRPFMLKITNFYRMK